MGKFSTSSHQSKPLLILSLVVSLFLHAGGFYLLLKHPPSLFLAHEIPVHEMETMDNTNEYEVDFAANEAFKSLILKEDLKESFSPPFQFPQSESIKTPLIITNHSYVPDIDYFAVKPPPLIAATYVPKLIENSIIVSKISPFSGKKGTNFSQEFAKGSIEGLAPASFIAQKTFDLSISNPDLEEGKNKYDFMKETLRFSFQAKHIPSAFFSFDLSQDSSILIAREIEHKKYKTPLSPFPSEPLPFAMLQTFATEQLKDFPPLSPEKESSQKHLFDDDNYQFSINDPLFSTPPLAFQKQPKDEYPLSISPLCPPKGSWTSPPEYASEYFSSLKLSDLSVLKNDIEDVALYPRLEQKQKLPLLKTTKHSLSLDPNFSSILPFTLEKTKCMVASRAIVRKKGQLPNPTFAIKPLNLSPPLDAWEMEPSSIESTYCPLKEALSPLTTTEDLSYNYPFKIETSPKIISFNFSEEGSLIIPKQNDGLFSQKEPSVFKESAIVIQMPHISIENSMLYQALPPTPTTEKKPSFSQTDLSFEIAPLRSKALFEESAFLIALPKTLRPNEFPRKSLFPSTRESSLALTNVKPLSSHKPIEKEAEPLFTPFLEHQKMPLPTTSFSIPHISTSIPSHFSSLDTTKNTIFSLKLQEPSHEKSFFKEQQEIGLTLLQIKNKTPLLPPQHIQTHRLIANKQQPTYENISQSPLAKPLTEPLRPAYYPPKIPALVIKHSQEHSLKKMSFEPIKKKLFLEGIEAKDLNLPFLGRKTTIPKSAFDTFSSAETLFSISSRPIQYPNTKNLIEKNLCPSNIPCQPSPSITVKKEVLYPPIIDETRSQAQEMIEDYDQENRASAGYIALATPKLEKSPNDLELHSLNQNHRFTQAFLSEIPIPSSLETVSFNNEFETQVHYTPREDGKGYDFALKMKPNNRLYFESPEKNVLFIIDGSSSIKKNRFNVFKDGVVRALPYLKKGDSFNILITDAKLISMNKTSIPWSKKTLIEARQFLDSRSYRGFFINYNAFDLISKVLPYLDFEKENVIVFLTDGHSLNSISHHKEALQQLSAINQNNLSIFTASIGQSNNLTMLDLMSTFNNGESMYSKTHAAFPRKLAVLIKHIGSFLAKNIHIQIASKSPDTGIEFYPNEQLFPSFYSDRPYTIYGSTKDLKDFDLVLQGRSNDQWINIKQHISFKNAEKATYAMKRNMALQRAYTCYDYYLQKEDFFFLAEAERVLKPYSIPSATY